MGKNKIFWVYVIIISLVYVGLFFFIIFQISGSFSVETASVNKINFEELPSSFDLNRNQEFSLDIDYKEGYEFSDNTELFDINKTTGEISFVPENVGLDPVVIVALKDITEYEAKVVVFNIQ